MKNKNITISRIVRFILCLIFLYIVFSCACSLTLEINKNNAIDTNNILDTEQSETAEDYKTLIIYYYHNNELESKEAEKCIKKVQKEAISLAINNNQLRKDGITYYDWELKNNPIIEILDEKIIVCVNPIYKSKKSTYEPHYIVTYIKENNKWEGYVKRDSYDVIFNDYYDTNNAEGKLAFEGFFDIELINSNDYDKFKKVFFFNAKKMGDNIIELYSIKINADYDTIRDLWVDRIAIEKITNNEIEYKRINFRTFSIEVPDFWEYEIIPNNSYDNSSNTIIFKSVNNCLLYVNENNDYFTVGNTHCVQSAVGLICPIEYNSKTNLDSYYLEEKQLLIERKGNIEDGVFYYIISSIE